MGDASLCKEALSQSVEYLLSPLLGKLLLLFLSDLSVLFGAPLLTTFLSLSAFCLPYFNSFFPSTLLQDVGSGEGK